MGKRTLQLKKVRLMSAVVFSAAKINLSLFEDHAVPSIQSALVIRTTFVPLCFFEKNVLITSGTYECSYNQRNYLVFWKSVLMAHVLITRFLYDVLISRVLITRVDCTTF